MRYLVAILLLLSLAGCGGGGSGGGGAAPRSTATKAEFAGTYTGLYAGIGPTITITIDSQGNITGQAAAGVQDNQSCAGFAIGGSIVALGGTQGSPVAHIDMTVPGYNFSVCSNGPEPGGAVLSGTVNNGQVVSLTGTMSSGSSTLNPKLITTLNLVP